MTFKRLMCKMLGHKTVVWTTIFKRTFSSERESWCKRCGYKIIESYLGMTGQTVIEEEPPMTFEKMAYRAINKMWLGRKSL